MIESLGRWLLIGLYVVAALGTAGHALLNKRDPRSAWGWIAVCWLFPLAGAALYYLFGVNRIETRAKRVFGKALGQRRPASAIEHLPEIPGLAGAEARELVRIGDALTERRLSRGNRVTPLFTGADAYNAMIEAINTAQHHVHLASYIYRDDAAGQRFAAALTAAQQRGVRVRVLLDGLADALYRPPASKMLHRHGIQPALFLPPRLWPPMLHINLRNHRKLLIVDGEIGYTGGMNIQQQHVAAADGEAAIDDVHFCVRGPLVQQMEDAFLADWRFAAGESVTPQSPPAVAADGNIIGRVITDGPNEDLDRLVMVLISAISAAHRRIWIMTPYFLPPTGLTSALQAAALRGIDVSIVLPRRSDQRWMDWATQHILRHLLEREVRVYLRPPPFAHTKLLIVDDWYVQFGSANLDTRSLRLNFELTIEAYGMPLAAEMAAHFESVRNRSRPATRAEMVERNLALRLRNALCWLGSPYL